MTPRAVLFDLDGTLVQTREASWKIFARTSEAFGLGVATQQEFFRLLEDNLFVGLRRLCGDDRRAEKVARHFLSQLEADYAPEFVPGMVDVVRALAGNCSLAVVSSNSIATIRRIMTRAGLAHCFSHVFGGDVEPDKRAVVRRFLGDQSYLVNRECSPAYRESDRPLQAAARDLVLVTDTTGDVKHARECGVRVVGVAWGMHKEQALLDAGAEFVAVWPQELVAQLQPGGFASAVCALSAAPTCKCGETPGDGVGRACGDGDIATAGRLRRERSRRGVSALANRLGEADAPTSRVAERAEVAREVDATLLRCLARLRPTPFPTSTASVLSV